MELPRAVVDGHTSGDEAREREVLAVQLGARGLSREDVVRLARKQRHEEHRCGTVSPPVGQRGRRDEYPAGSVGFGDELCGWGVLFRFQPSSFAYSGQSPDIHWHDP